MYECSFVGMAVWAAHQIPDGPHPGKAAGGVPFGLLAARLAQSFHGRTKRNGRDCS